MTASNWWQLGGYTLLCIWLMRMAWLIFDADLGDDE